MDLDINDVATACYKDPFPPHELWWVHEELYLPTEEKTNRQHSVCI